MQVCRYTCCVHVCVSMHDMCVCRYACVCVEVYMMSACVGKYVCVGIHDVCMCRYACVCVYT